MDEQVLKYSWLGFRTLFIFILKRSGFLFFLALLTIALIFSETFIPAKYAAWVNLAVIAEVTIGLLIVFLLFLIGFLDYARYKIFLTGQSLEVSRGIISIKETGIPYRRVKEASIKRGVLAQILGISDLVITVFDEGDDHSNRTIILPALDKNIADHIQKIILQKAEIEEMSLGSK